MAVSSTPQVRNYDDPKSIACLLLFLLAALVTIQPVLIPVPIPNFVPQWLYRLRLRNDSAPLPSRIFKVHLDLNIGPVLAVLILLASKCIGIEEFRAGIKGVGDVHPYDILLLFLSLVCSGT